MFGNSPIDIALGIEYYYQDQVNPIIGYRRLARVMNSVCSPIHFDYYWKRGWNECAYHNKFLGIVANSIPNWGNETGLYAFFEYNRAWQYNTSYQSPLETVVVKVEGAGVVIEHDAGFRAQYMRVIGVDDFATSKRDQSYEFMAEFFAVPLIQLGKERNPYQWKLPPLFWKD